MCNKTYRFLLLFLKVKSSRKKMFLFLRGPVTKSHRNFFPYIKKRYFFLSGTVADPSSPPPPPLSGPATKKKTFFCGFSNQVPQDVFRRKFWNYFDSGRSAAISFGAASWIRCIYESQAQGGNILWRRALDSVNSIEFQSYIQKTFLRTL